MITLQNYNDKTYTFKNKSAAIRWLKSLTNKTVELDEKTHIVYVGFLTVWGIWVEE